MKTFVHRILFILILLGIWEILSKANLLNPFFLPAPTKILESFIDLLADGQLIIDLLVSLKRVLFGFLISVLTAVPLGLFLGINKKIKHLVNPLINFIRPIPPIAWIPLAIIWFGIGNTTSYFITMIASFFPIFINTITGVEDIPQKHLDVAKSFGVDKKILLIHIIIPYVFPFILSGMRIGLGIGWMAVVAAEMISAFSGLGYSIIINQEMLRMDRVLVNMITIGMAGLLLDTFVLKLKNRFIQWN